MRIKKILSIFIVAIMLISIIVKVDAIPTNANPNVMVQAGDGGGGSSTGTTTPTTYPSLDINNDLEQIGRDNGIGDAINNDEAFVILCQGEYINKANRYYDNDSSYTIDLSQAGSFNINSSFVLYLYAENAWAKKNITLTVLEGNITSENTKTKLETHNRNAAIGAIQFKFKNLGVQTIKVNLKDSNGKVDLTITLTVNVDHVPTPVDKLDFGAFQGEMRDELKNKQVGIKVQHQGEWLGDADTNYIHKFENLDFSKGEQTITLDISGSNLLRNENINLFFQLEKRGLSDISVTGLEQNNSFAKYTSQAATVDGNGLFGNSTASVLITFNVGYIGSHEIKFKVETDETDINVIFKVNIGSKLGIFQCDLDYEAECEAASKELGNKDLRVVIVHGDQRIVRNYKNMKRNKRICYKFRSKI